MMRLVLVDTLYSNVWCWWCQHWWRCRFSRRWVVRRHVHWRPVLAQEIVTGHDGQGHSHRSHQSRSQSRSQSQDYDGQGHSQGHSHRITTVKVTVKVTTVKVTVKVTVTGLRRSRSQSRSQSQVTSIKVTVKVTVTGHDGQGHSQGHDGQGHSQGHSHRSRRSRSQSRSQSQVTSVKVTVKVKTVYNHTTVTLFTRQVFFFVSFYIVFENRIHVCSRRLFAFEDLRPVTLIYYVVKLLTASHTFGNNVKITSFPVWIYV